MPTIQPHLEPCRIRRALLAFGRRLGTFPPNHFVQAAVGAESLLVCLVDLSNPGVQECLRSFKCGVDLFLWSGHSAGSEIYRRSRKAPCLFEASWSRIVAGFTIVVSVGGQQSVAYFFDVSNILCVEI